MCTADGCRRARRRGRTIRPHLRFDQRIGGHERRHLPSRRRRRSPAAGRRGDADPRRCRSRDRRRGSHGDDADVEGRRREEARELRTEGIVRIQSSGEGARGDPSRSRGSCHETTREDGDPPADRAFGRTMGERSASPRSARRRSQEARLGSRSLVPESEPRHWHCTVPGNLLVDDMRCRRGGEHRRTVAARLGRDVRRIGRCTRTASSMHELDAAG
mmetsp:Transcript_5759/g.35792  ORF Transcript_5759/g.35792 Transcript_5759/m.35792 type:complete len:217 (-) Transcript_5759:4363-5013(-)